MAAIKGQFIVDALFVGFMVTGTAVVSVGLGVLGAYYAITGLLAAVNPARPVQFLQTLIPNQNHVSGD